VTDEVDRDREAEADPLEPRLHGLSLRPVEHEADDQAGGEGAEHEVEADVVREPQEASTSTESRTAVCAVVRIVSRRMRSTRGGRARSAIVALPATIPPKTTSRMASSPAP
jgi:hypothetical protein